MNRDKNAFPQYVEIRLSLLLVSVILCGQLHGQPISELVVFGDSISDIGNLNSFRPDIAPSPPYYMGRISNGPIWVERLADRLGVASPAASRLGGMNFAWGGATTGAVSNFEEVDDMDEQIQKYLSANEPSSNQLFAIWIGVNDFWTATTASSSATMVATHLRSLIDAGGENFLVNNLSLYHGVTDRVPEFNTLLADELAALMNDHAAVSIHEFDYFEFMNEVVSAPLSFGFQEPFAPACRDCGQGTLGTNIVPLPNQHYFWDEIHPTTAAHRLIGDAAFDVVILDWIDFNGDENADVDDLDALVGEIVAGTNHGLFDLTGDDIVDESDISQWLTTSANRDGFSESYLAGDSNLDGAVNSLDLNNLALSWQQDIAIWSGGDFTADGVVNSSDLNELALNWQRSIPMSATQSVPEPPRLPIPVFTGLAALVRRYTSRKK